MIDPASPLQPDSAPSADPTAPSADDQTSREEQARLLMEMLQNI